MSTPLDKKKFIKAKLEGKNNIQAALEAGSKNKISANKAAFRLLKDINIKRTINKSIAKQGITLDDLIKPFTEALKATKISTDKETSELYDSGIPEHLTRMKASEKLMEISGIKQRIINDKNEGKPNKIINGKVLKTTNEIELQEAILQDNED